MVHEIRLDEISGIRIGQAEDREGGTGCTVLIAENGIAAGLDIRGGGPASRESGLLDPLASAKAVHAVVLAGGSAFGLGAADGVMRYLKEKGIGFDVGPDLKVPLVCQSDLFDLTLLYRREILKWRRSWQSTRWAIFMIGRQGRKSRDFWPKIKKHSVGQKISCMQIQR